MTYPVRWDGPGKLGALALFFPLHLLLFTLIAGVLAFFAKRSHAVLATGLFGLVIMLTVMMALTPSMAIWQQAGEFNVSLSLTSILQMPCI